MLDTRSQDFDVLAGASDPIKAGEIKKDKIEYVLSLVSPIYDFILVDVGQAINPLSIAVLDHCDQICVVVQPTIAFARTGRRLLDILHGLHYPRKAAHPGQPAWQARRATTQHAGASLRTEALPCAS